MRVVIIGGGVIGLCSAYYAARAGHNVTVLEARGPEYEGASLGNAGMIVPSHFVPLAAPGMIGLGLRMMLRRDSPFTIRPRLSRDLLAWMFRFWRSCTAAHVKRSAPLLRDLNMASRAAYEELEQEIGGFGLVKRGLIMLCKTEVALAEEAHLAEMARGLDVPAEVLDPPALAKLDPAIRMDVAAGVYLPQDCHLEPERFVGALRRACDAAGVDVRSHSEVRSWRRDSGRLAAVQTATDEVKGDQFVLASGAWSPRLAGGLGLRLPMQAGKGYSLTLPKPPQLPSICSILTEARVAVTPMGGALRFAGTMEIGGGEAVISKPRVDGIIRSSCSYFPAFSPGDFAGVPVWSGLRPCSPDGLPYVGRTSRYSNLIVAAGHSMMGLSLGPITGKLVAGLISGEPLPLDISHLSPDRYA